MDIDSFLEANESNYYSSYESSYEDEPRRLHMLRDGDTEDFRDWLMDSKEEYKNDLEEVRKLAHKLPLDKLNALLRHISQAAAWNGYDKVKIDGDKVLCIYTEDNYPEPPTQNHDELTKNEWAVLCGFDNWNDLEDIQDIWREKQSKQYINQTRDLLAKQTA